MAEVPNTMEDRVKALEVKANEMAAKVNTQLDAKADNFVAGLAKKLIDSRFTWAFLTGASVFGLMMFYVCV